ncbi:erg24, C-14 sterol reductase, partial [Blyttiomyces sp. JEL0837]
MPTATSRTAAAAAAGKDVSQQQQSDSSSIIKDNKKNKQGKADVLNPISTHFEFMGPHMTPLVILGLIIVPITLHNLCSAETGCPPSWLYSGTDIPSNLAKLYNSQTYWNPLSMAVILGWMTFHIILYYTVPCLVIDGTLIRDGSRLKYPINAFGALLISLASVAGITAMYGLEPMVWVADNYLPLAVSSIIMCLVMSTLLYLASFRQGALLALGGNSGYPLYDFFIGRELNPRLFGLDLKYFCELRPGLIGWVMLNLAFVAKQANESPDGFWGVSSSMWLVVAFQGYYVVDALWNEAAILTTMDITTDGFGFMLNFGDLAWVPFTYTIQARYLSFHPVHLSPLAVVGLIALKLFGLYIFRGSNGQKNAFRTNPKSPECKHLKFMETASGSKLLITGWWGVARHINYT